MWLGCLKAGIRLQAEKGGGGSGRQDMAIRRIRAVLTQPELGRMKANKPRTSRLKPWRASKAYLPSSLKPSSTPSPIWVNYSIPS
jgi:hypothetical protein